MTIKAFETVDNARWIEIRGGTPGDAPGGWNRTSIRDLDLHLETITVTATSGITVTELDSGEVDQHQLHDGARITRGVRIDFTRQDDTVGAFIEFRELAKYHGLYEQIEALKSWAMQEFKTGEDIIALMRAVDDVLAHDQAERDALAPSGYCRHGVYVGGCGIDWMCGPCEDGSE